MRRRTYSPRNHGGGGKDYDAISWMNAITALGGSVADSDVIVVSNFAKALKAQGLYSIWDRLVFPCFGAAGNTAPGLVDLIGRTAGTAVNSPTFTYHGGVAGNGSSSYINSNYAPASGTNFTLNSGSVFAYSNTSRAAGNIQPIGLANGATTQILISSFFTGSVAHGRVNNSNATAASGATTDNLGLALVSRTANNLTTMYKRGVSVGTTTTTPVSIPTGNLTICALNNDGVGIIDYDTAQIPAYGMGAGITSPQEALFNSIFEDTLLTPIGASV